MLTPASEAIFPTLSPDFTMYIWPCVGFLFVAFLLSVFNSLEPWPFESSCSFSGSLFSFSFSFSVVCSSDIFKINGGGSGNGNFIKARKEINIT